MAEKIKVIGIGSLGCHIMDNLSACGNLPLLILDTDICPLKWFDLEKLLCGKNTCRGLGCGGNIDRGYAAAKETLSESMNLFYENEVNIFVLGLGGGAGTGMIQFILKQLRSIRRKEYNKNKCNIVVCTYPCSLEVKRRKKAAKVLDKIKDWSDMLVLFSIDDIGKSTKIGLSRYHVMDLFRVVSFEIQEHVLNILSLSNAELSRFIQDHSGENKLLEIKSKGSAEKLFKASKEQEGLLKKLRGKSDSKKFLHFTGEERDYEQLKALSSLVKKEKTFMFIGCSNGEEILGFQKLMGENPYLFFGVDSDSHIVNIAKHNQYSFKTKIVVADILKDDFSETIKTETGFSKFDVVICRNLMIYYDQKTVNQIVERLAEMTSHFLIIGRSDPFQMVVAENKVQIKDAVFEVVDFDNKILKMRATLKQLLLKEISHLRFESTKAATKKVLKIRNTLCQNCNKEESTYKIRLNRKMMLLCDYCFYYLKYKNKGQKIVVDSHLATKKGVNNRVKAIKKYLLPRISKKIDKKLAAQLLEIEKKKGGDALIDHIREKQQELAKFLIEKNISYYELRTCLELRQKIYKPKNKLSARRQIKERTDEK